MGTSTRIGISALGPVRCGARLWRQKGALYVTAVAKATFELVEGEAVAVAPEPLDRGPIVDASRSVIHTPNDVVPMREKVDVVIDGQLRSNSRSASSHERMVRLRVGRGDDTLIDTQVVVVDLPEESTTQFDGAALRNEIEELDDDAEASDYQVAPPNQQLDELLGNEWLELDGIGERSVRSQLPTVRARGQIADPSDGRLRNLEMRPDTLVIDSAHALCSITWRGSFLVDQSALDGLDLALLVESRGILLAGTQDENAVPSEPPGLSEPAGDDDDERDITLRRKIPRAKVKIGRADPYQSTVAKGPPTSEAEPIAHDPSFADTEISAGIVPEEGVPSSKLPPSFDAEVLKATIPRREQPLPSDPRAAVLQCLELDQSMEGLDLSGADLSHLDLSRRSLRCVQLVGTKLEGCKLSGSDLSTACLEGADLTDALLDGANLQLCDLSETTLDGATFEGAHLDRADFARAHGVKTSFRDTSGRDTCFVASRWWECCFDAATIAAADFSAAELHGCSFVEAKMPELRLRQARGRRVSFEGAELRGAHGNRAELEDARFDGVVAPGSTWNRAQLRGASFRSARLEGASFVSADCERAVLNEANLRGARLEWARLAKADLRGCDVTDARLDHANLEDVRTDETTRGWPHDDIS